MVFNDRYFLDRICDQIIAFEDDGIAVQAGNDSYYLEKRQAREAAERIQAQAAARGGRPAESGFARAGREEGSQADVRREERTGGDGDGDPRDRAGGGGD